MSDPAKACAWCLEEHQLVPLDGTTVDQALLAMMDGTLSHGMCVEHSDAMRVKHGLAPR